MLDPAITTIVDLYPSADRLLELSEGELERVLLRYVVAVTDDQMRRMGTRDAVITGLYGRGGYEYDFQKHDAVQKAIIRGWKALEDADLIEEPDPANGKNGYRVVSKKGRSANAAIDFAAVKVGGQFTREMFHSSLPASAWNAFRSGDYDSSVFEAFKAVESAVRKKGGFPTSDYGVQLMDKAFDPNNGPLTDKAAPFGRREARRNLFKGALGELRNPKAHGDPTIKDPMLAVEEIMTASVLLRIVDNA